MGLEIMNFLMSMFILLGVLLHNTSTVNIYVHNIIIIIINWYRLHIFYQKNLSIFCSGFEKMMHCQYFVYVCECVRECVCVCECVCV